MATVNKRTPGKTRRNEMTAKREPFEPVTTVNSEEESEDGSEDGGMSEEEYSGSEEEDSLQDAFKADISDSVDEESYPVPAPVPVQNAPELLEDFVRNFLHQAGLNRTFDCFQTEWFELLQKKGAQEAHEAEIGLVPDAHVHNRILRARLEEARKARDAHRDAAARAERSAQKLRKERDYHRLQHLRLLQEKKQLAEELKRVRKICETNECVMKELEQKYRAALRRKTLLGIQRDRVSAQMHIRDDSLPNTQANCKGFTETGDLQRRGNIRRTLSGICVTPYDPGKDPTKGTACKHPKDSEFPKEFPFLPQITAPSKAGTGAFYFSLTKSLQAHSLAVSSLALHPQKPVVASASDDRLWRIWGLPEGELMMSGEGHSDWLSSCAFHPKGGCLATTSGDTTVKIWDFARGRCVLTLEGHARATWGCSFHSSGDFVASCSMDNTAKVWDLNSERCRYTLRGHVNSVNSVAFLPFSNVLLTGSADKTLSLWDARAGLCTQTFYGHRHSCNSATFSPLGDMMASCDSYGVLKLWDMRTASSLVTVNAGPHPANQVAFSPDGHVLVSASDDGTVKLVEVPSLHMSVLTGPGDAVQSVTFDHKGEYLLSAGYNGEIFLWS